MANAKIEIADIQDIILQKDNEIKSLKKQLDIRKNVEWHEPYYFLENEQGKEGPYCQSCYDSEGKLIRLQGAGREGLWICLNCKNKVHDLSYKPEKMIVTSRSRR